MNMKLKLILTIFVLVFLINGWTWSTHQIISEKIINSLPRELNLNISLVKEGSIAPDKYFKDFRYHNYPYTINSSDYWIKKAKYFYSINDINNASYSFGVLSHYISDTFAAPHTVSKEEYELHKKFENQASNYIPISNCQKYNLNLKKELENSVSNKEDWYLWLKSKNIEIPKKEIEQAVKVLYPVALNIFNTNCINPTKIDNSEISLTIKNIFFILIIFMFIVLLTYSIFLNTK